MTSLPVNGIIVIERRWALQPHAIALIQQRLGQSERDAFQTLKELVVDERVIARGPWPPGGIAGEIRTGRADNLPAELFNYADRAGDGVTFVGHFVVIDWVEIDMNELWGVLDRLTPTNRAEERAPVPAKDKKKNHRPQGTGFAKQDEPGVHWIEEILSRDLTGSATMAASWIPEKSLPPGSSLDGARDRLVRRYKAKRRQ
jgi:hypothetical protein